ncbi:MPT63 family protein [Mycolicibacterium vanbaalenii]|uniref:MPT63 family protein n=1 Tax=Mycolicibacterium vanbaalenii TaxID=110539 RepID=UPI00132F5574|nr:MPT63 family protein [Mycolicibacterium vanbaalenii]
MKIKPAFVATAAAAAAAISVAAAPFASAEDVEIQSLGEPGELVNGDVVQHWTVTGLKPSTDTIPYQPTGTLWEATATDEAISGSAIPIVANLNARAENGDTYRVLFGVATSQGVNPATLAPGETTTGKVYFDVTGEQPDSVAYNAGGQDLLVWVEAPPAPASGSTGTSVPAQTYTTTTPSAPSDSSDTAETAEPAPEAGAAEETPAPTATPVPAGSAGTPLPEGSSGTPLPEGSSGTPLPEGAAPAPDAAPSPVPAAVAPEGSSGTPLPEGSTGTPAPEGAAPTTTVVAPAPPA